jgi:uncharacterized membrane protein
MPKWPAYLMAAGAAACAVPAITMSAPAPAEQYSARGQGPDWTLNIENGRIDLVEEEAGRTTVLRPEPRSTFNGRRYETQAFVIDISHSPCTDEEGEAFDHQVMVVTAGATLRGCGRSTAEEPIQA